MAVLIAVIILVLWRDSPARSSDAGWMWPTSPVGITRPYIAPATEYAPGHRGLDLQAKSGDPIVASAAGRVSFVGSVAGSPIVTIDQGGGWTTTYLPMNSKVALNEHVRAGQLIGDLAPESSHCTCLHFGLRYFGAYVSPLIKLGQVPRAVLLPW